VDVPVASADPIPLPPVPIRSPTSGGNFGASFNLTIGRREFAG